MAFWGVEVEPGKPIVHASKRRIRITQATLGSGNASEKCVLQCSIGSRNPVFLCSLMPNKIESCNLNLEFEEDEDVIFSVIGSQSVHLVGGFVNDGHNNLKDRKQREKQIKMKNQVSESDDAFELQKTDTLDCDLKEKDHEQERKKDEAEVTPQEIEPLEGTEVAIKEDVQFDCKTLEDNALEHDVEQDLPIDKNEDDQQSVKRKRDIEIKEDDVTADKDVEDMDGTGKDNNIPASPSINAESRFEDGHEAKKMKEATDIVATAPDNILLETSDKEKMMEKDVPIEAPSSFAKDDVSGMPLDVKTLSDGLVVEILERGDPNGKVAMPGKKVKVNITGLLEETQRVIESNVGRSACRYMLGTEDVIDGLNMGVEGMCIGEKRRIIIPPSLGFGEEGFGEKVPPNSWLVYYVELLGVRSR